MRTVTINGVDLRDQLGIHTNPREALGDAAALEESEGALPGRAGVVPDSDLVTVSPRDLSIPFDAKGATQSALDVTLDRLRALLLRGTLEVVFAHLPTRAYYARYRKLSVARIGPAYSANAARGTIGLRCLDPYAYDLEPEVIGIAAAATDVACPTGTAPSWPVVRIMGGATSPTLTLKSSSGATLGTLGLSVTLTASEYLDLDMAAQTVTKVSSGVASDAYSALASGDFFALPEFDPQAGAAPTLRVSSGTALVFYRKAWL